LFIKILGFANPTSIKLDEAKKKMHEIQRKIGDGQTENILKNQFCRKIRFIKVKPTIPNTSKFLWNRNRV
jgi:hypothetical protein